jgi:3-hydroxyisobutyrate dehydrogenase-like beta-hydroxyacid dehydrogenase
VKICGNFLSFTAAQAMAEALSMAKKNGLDPTQVIEMLTETQFPAPIYQNFGKLIARDPERFSLSQRPSGWIVMKDVAIFKDTALQAESKAPLAELLHELIRLEHAIDPQSNSS